MRLKFFTVPAIGSADAESDVNSFLASKRVLAVDRQLVRESGGAYWAIAVTYDESTTGRTSLKRAWIHYNTLAGANADSASADAAGRLPFASDSLTRRHSRLTVPRRTRSSSMPTVSTGVVLSWSGGRRRMPERYSGVHGRGHQGTNRVIRGGSWNSNAQNVRAAYRNRNHPSNRNDNLGFRLARAQIGPRGAVADPAIVRSARIAAGGEHALGRRRASRAPGGAARAHRRPDSSNL